MRFDFKEGIRRIWLDPPTDQTKFFFGMRRAGHFSPPHSADYEARLNNTIIRARRFVANGQASLANQCFSDVIKMAPFNVELLMEYGNFLLSTIDEDFHIHAEGPFARVLFLEPGHHLAISGRQQVLFNAERNLDKSLQNAFEYISPNFILIGQGERKAFEARLEPFVRIENIHNSTAIEGNTLTRQQVIDVLNGKPVSSARGIQNNEEVLGLAAATDFLLSTMQKQQKFTFTLELLLGAHQRVLDGSSGKKAKPGYLRDVDVYITNVLHRPIKHEFVEEEMALYINWLNSELTERKMNRVEFAILAHFLLAYLHPFRDGNGRMARLVMTTILALFELPPLIIFVEDKCKYIEVLEKADLGDMLPFIQFNIQQMVKTFSKCLTEA